MDLECISNIVIGPEEAKLAIFDQKIFKIHKLNENIQ